MASPALIVREDGSFEATPELKETLHMRPGTRLELVQHTGQEVRFRVPSAVREIHSWRDLRGILADSPEDPNADLERERLRELEEDGR